MMFDLACQMFLAKKNNKESTIYPYITVLAVFVSYLLCFFFFYNLSMAGGGTQEFNQLKELGILAPFCIFTIQSNRCLLFGPWPTINFQVALEGKKFGHP